MVTSILFYLFSLITIAAALTVITVKNPVHSVFALILAFFNAAALFVLLGAELLAMVLVIVYVGAVAVLFLFVVMMLNINITKVREGFLRYLPLGLLIAGFLFFELFVLFSQSIETINLAPAAQSVVAGSSVTNAHAIGKILYTDYVYPFQIAGLVLLIAMVGAIMLTLRHRDGVKRQNAGTQIFRDSKTSVTLVKVKSRGKA